LVVPISDGRELTLAGNVFSRDQGLPGYGAIRQTTATALDTLRATGSLTYESSRDAGRGSRLRALAYYLFERQRYHDPLGEIALTPSDTDNQLSQVGTNLLVSRPLRSWALLSVVFDARYELFRPYDSLAREPRLPPGTRVFVGAGIDTAFRVRPARLTITPSLRVEAASDQRTGRDRQGTALPDDGRINRAVPTARLALAATLTRWLSLRANGARYARLPAMSELYGDSGYVIGNPSLTPETGWNVDVGMSLYATSARFAVSFDVTGFASFVDDLIQFQQESYGRAIALNLGAARIAGVEAALEVRLTR
jgi:outer membrane receptor protein involved in Fe transport